MTIGEWVGGSSGVASGGSRIGSGASSIGAIATARHRRAAAALAIGSTSVERDATISAITAAIIVAGTSTKSGTNHRGRGARRTADGAAAALT